MNKDGSGAKAIFAIFLFGMLTDAKKLSLKPVVYMRLIFFEKLAMSR